MNRRRFLQSAAGAAVVRPFREGEPFAVRPGEPLFLLESSTVEDMWAMRRRVNRLVKSPRNPVLGKTEAWEGSGPYTYGTVLYDPRDKLLKCWYTVYHEREYRQKLPGSYLTGYATSKDGYTWEKPNLGLVEWRGSRNNSLIRLGERYNAPVAVVLAPAESGVGARFVCCYLDQPGVCIAVSDDGVNWRDSRVIEKHHSDTHNCITWDAVRRRWLVSLRQPLYAYWTNRRMALMESTDLVNWTRPTVSLAPDEQDYPEFYGMPVFQRGHLLFGLLQIYNRPAGSIENELVFSSDGRKWERVPPRETFLTRGPAGSFDAGMTFASSAPVIVGDEMRFYYGAIRTDHNQRTADDEAIGSVGLGTVGLDRMFGVTHSSEKDPGVMVTRPLVFHGKALRMNASVEGSARVAVTDADGKALPGFDLADCGVIRGDSLRHTVEWKGGPLPAGRPVRLKVRMEKGTFWAFYLS